MLSLRTHEIGETILKMTLDSPATSLTSSVPAPPPPVCPTPSARACEQSLCQSLHCREPHRMRADRGGSCLSWLGSGNRMLISAQLNAFKEYRPERILLGYLQGHDLAIEPFHNPYLGIGCYISYY